VRANATVRFGGVCGPTVPFPCFTVSRIGVAGTYRIVIPATPSGRFLATTVTTATPAGVPPPPTITFARIISYSKNPLDNSHTIDIEIHDLLGTLVDGDFTFIVIDRS
jgi:hypothetical protein